jgi:two-component system heavy metal sensor histidine kinase CusS
MVLAQALAEHHGLNLVYEVRGDGVALIDSIWIRQVLLNVLSNAIKVSPPGGRLRIEGDAAHGRWRVAITDEGPGVPDADIERIFDRFVRLSAGASTSTGSGLGLAISRSVVQLHGGRIFARNAHPGLEVAFELDLQP